MTRSLLRIRVFFGGNNVFYAHVFYFLISFPFLKPFLDCDGCIEDFEPSFVSTIFLDILLEEFVWVYDFI